MNSDGVELEPGVLVNALTPHATGSGAAWSLSAAQRDLDANVVFLEPGESIDQHVGPDIDVLVHVIAGSGVLLSDRSQVPLASSDIAWLPRRSTRSIEAGEEGLRYLTVHRKREPLGVTQRRTDSEESAK